MPARNFQPKEWIAKKTASLNAYMRNAGLKTCVCSISGGIDSAVTLALCAEAMRVPVVALFVFDDRAGALAVRSLVGETGIRPGSLNVPTFQTATSISRGKSGLFAVSNLASRKDTRDAAERQKFGATGYLGAPINGPAGDVVGVLAAMTMTEHQWTRRERRLITSYAYLAYEQIMLRAALNTVKLMAEEQQAVESVVSYTN